MCPPPPSQNRVKSSFKLIMHKYHAVVELIMHKYRATVSYLFDTGSQKIQADKHT